MHDEKGREIWVRRGPWWDQAREPLSDAERARMEGQLEEIRALIERRPRDLLEYYRLGRVMYGMERERLWFRTQWKPGGTKSLSRYLSEQTKYSRQKIDRLLLVAQAYSQTTIEECHAAGVGIRVMVDMVAADWRCRPVLLKLARQGAPLLALLQLRPVAERHLAHSPIDMDLQQLQQEMEPVLQEAYKTWRSPPANPAPAAPSDHRQESVQVRDLLAVRNEVAATQSRLSKREMDLFDQKRVLAEKSATLANWERSLAEREFRLEERERQIAAREEQLGLTGQEPAPC